MRTIKKHLLGMRVLLGLGLSVMTLSAQALDPGVEVKLGTMGAGLDIVFGVDEHFSARLGFSSLVLSDTFTDDEGIDYDVDLTLGGTYLLADWHPMGGGFRLTGGIIVNRNNFSGDAELPAGATVKVGDDDYVVCDGMGGGDLCGMSVDLGFAAVAPYLGVGWGSSSKGGRFAFSADIGFMFQGEPKIDVDVDSPSGNVTDESIAAEEVFLEQELEDYADLAVYPVINLGLAIRF